MFTAPSYLKARIYHDESEDSQLLRKYFTNPGVLLQDLNVQVLVLTCSFVAVELKCRRVIFIEQVGLQGLKHRNQDFCLKRPFQVFTLTAWL